MSEGKLGMNDGLKKDYGSDGTSLSSKKVGKGRPFLICGLYAFFTVVTKRIYC